MSWLEQIPDELINIRPLVFLCGPFFDETDKKDRRTILRKYLRDYEKQVIYKEKKYIIKPFALVVDNLFSNDDLEERENVTLIEEIIATCAFKNYIFVDTMSTALELGLFSNSYAQNKTTAFLPSDYKLFKPSIGYFVTQTIKKSSNIDLCEYKNKRTNKIIKDKGITSVAENIISFRGNIIPNQIKQEVEKNFNKDANEFLIKFEFTTNPKENSKIYFDINESSLYINVPAMMLLYLINEFQTKEDILIKLFSYFQKHVYSERKELISKCYLYKKNLLALELDSEFKYDINEVISSMQYLINALKERISIQNFTTLKYEKVDGRYVHSKLDVYDLFWLSKEEDYSLRRINRNKGKAIHLKKLVINGKKRNVSMYAPNSEGFELRLLNSRIINKISELISLQPYSYAYKKNCSIIKCVQVHLNSNYFLKLDIKNFFNSISKNIMNKIVKCHLCDNPSEAYEKNIVCLLSDYKSSIIKSWDGTEKILDSCFNKGKLSLGLVSSPMLSNIYMDLFDYRLHIKFPELKYTRYSDDILISSEAEFDQEVVLAYIKNEFTYLKLFINTKKLHNYVLRNTGDHVKFLGLNIVKNLTENRITVGKQYINYVSKNISDFEKNISKLKHSQIVGQVEYIKFVSREDFNKLQEIYKIKTSKEFDYNKFKRTTDNRIFQ
ncbi:MAG: reverse transcriptase domain-containing protein [Mobilitalea sp.]